MPPSVLSVPAFGGGVVKEGSADAQRTDELVECKSYRIGPRGQLIADSDIESFASFKSSLSGFKLSPLYNLHVLGHPQAPVLIGVGDYNSNTYVSFLEPGGTSPGGASQGTPPVGGPIVTFASFPYVKDGEQLRLVLVCIAPRAHKDPRDGLGLFAVLYDAGGPFYSTNPISKYDSLGTGESGEVTLGTNAVQLYPRGVIAYNNHAFVWGFDNAETTTGDGPARLMFSNIGNPLKWGHDPDEGSTSDRAFEDSDAINVGGSGEAIRGCCVWRGKLWIGTNKELHFLEGFGRESFRTNGAFPIARSRNVIGPRAMIEGPDGLLYGISDEGLWVCDGAAVVPVGDKLRDFGGFSRGWWDLIWTDTSRDEDAFPGKSNQDLVWMFSDAEHGQVWIGIPFCSATNGYGYGSDTVVIKYHVATGGFTRQVFVGKILYGMDALKREGLATPARYVARNILGGAVENVYRYGYKSAQNASPVLPFALPDVTVGPYAPFGPNGVGVMRKRYLTLAWEAQDADQPPEDPSPCETETIVDESFNSYASPSELQDDWGPGAAGFLLANGDNPTLGQYEPPDASQFVHAVAAGGGDSTEAPSTWGTNTNTMTRTFTGLEPNTQHRVRFKMIIANSTDSVIGHAPAAHSFTAGVQASETERLLIAVSALKNGLPIDNDTEDPGIPEGIPHYAYAVFESAWRVGTKFPELEGWIDYDFLAMSNGDGEITLEVGKFDGRNFGSAISFDDIAIETVCL